MTTNQTVWLITWIIVLVCVLATLFIYLYTGNIIIALIVAPPIIHWILKRRQNKKDY